MAASSSTVLYYIAAISGRHKSSKKERKTLGHGLQALGDPSSQRGCLQFEQMDTAMLEWRGNGISESWAEAWPQLSRAQQLVALIRADFSPGNRHFGGLVSTTLRATWKQMASAVKDKMEA